MTAPSSHGLPTVRVIQDEAGWDAIRGDWCDLHAASPDGSAPLDFVWLRSWWRVYGRRYGAGGLRIVTLWRGSRLVGAVPLYLGLGASGRFGARTLRFVSTGEEAAEETCPEYLGLLCRPGEEDSCSEAFWRAVDRLAWDRVDFLDLPAGSPLLQGARASGDIQTYSRGGCPVADLTGGFDAYLQRLSANTRQQVRRLLRDAQRPDVQFELAGVDGVASVFDDLCRLHQERWAADQKPGVFAAPRFVEFHRALIAEWLPAGRAVLARLSVADEPVAVLYGFITGPHFAFYQSGVQRRCDVLKSPGTLAHLLLMRALYERGVQAYDFLRGASSYKERLATRESQLAGIRIWKRTLRGTASQSIHAARRVVNRYLGERDGVSP